jgi:FecR protein
MMNRSLRQMSFALVLFALPLVAQASTAGQVIFATGTVTAERGNTVNLSKGDDVLVADTVRTGSASRAQLLMLDGAKLAIRPDSAIRIDEYSYPAAVAGGNAVSTADPERSVTSLLKGGFRTITGAIGKGDEKDYEVRTAVGVLGIRGTDYTAVFCNADCSNAPGATSTPPENGLYLGVTGGVIFFRNEVTDIELRAGQFAFVPLDTRRPRRLNVPPPVLIDNIELAGSESNRPAPAGFDAKLGSRRQPEINAAPVDSDAADKDGTADDGTPAQPRTGTDADGNLIDFTPGQSPDPQRPPPGNRNISWSSGPLDGASGVIFSGAADNAPGVYQLDANGNIAAFDAPYPTLRQVNEQASFGIGSATLAESGSDTLTVMRWGRWASGSATITLASGADVSQNLDAQSLHWISSPEWQSAPAIPTSGTATYSLVGGTSPTDNSGNTGVLGSASLVADFTNQLVTSSLSLMINQQQWSATGDGVLGSLLDPPAPAHLFQGSYNSVDVDGISGGFGTFSGFFSEAGPSSDPAFPGGAGLTYTLQDMGGQTTVSGAAALGNP